MAEPKRLDVLRALTDWLKGITPTNGYTFDLSMSVHRGRSMYGEETPLPCLSILESPRADASPNFVADGDGRNENWVLFVQGWVEDDFENPTDPAYYLHAAVEHRLAKLTELRDDGSGRNADSTTYLLGGKIASLKMGPPVVRPPTEQVSAKAFFYLPIVVGLAVTTGKPYVS